MTYATTSDNNFSSDEHIIFLFLSNYTFKINLAKEKHEELNVCKIVDQLRDMRFLKMQMKDSTLINY